jgi:hypothetical protein
MNPKIITLKQFSIYKDEIFVKDMIKTGSCAISFRFKNMILLLNKN